MKYGFSGFFFLLSLLVNAQDCKLLTQTFAIADTMKKDSEELYLFRFSANQLDQLQLFPGMAKPVLAIKTFKKHSIKIMIPLKRAYCGN